MSLIVTTSQGSQRDGRRSLTGWSLARWLGITAALAALFGILALVDAPLYRAMRVEKWNEVYARKDWVMFFRTMGYLPLWAVLALVMELGQHAAAERSPALPGLPLRGPGGMALPRRVLPRHAGLLVLASAVLAGLLAEVLQEIIRRHRPSVTNQGAYVFDWTAGHIDGRGLGLASSHVAVVFGVAFMLWKFSPKMGFPMMLLGAGCALTRLWAGAHFLSDCVAAVVLAYVAALVLHRALAR